MHSIDTLNPTIDDEVHIYLFLNKDIAKASGVYVSSLHGGAKLFLCSAKIVAKCIISGSTFNYLLGWKTGEDTPNGTIDFNAASNAVPANHVYYTQSNDIHTYQNFLWLSGDAEIRRIVPNNPSPAQPYNNNVAAIKQAIMNAMHGYTTQRINIASNPDDLLGYPSFDAASTASIVKEKPCRNPTCGKMNDIGISKCWYCEVQNPTNY